MDYFCVSAKKQSGGLIGVHFLCQRQEGLWKVFFKYDAHCCRLFTLACAFIYCMVSHHKLPNVLWAINFSNALLRPFVTLTQQTYAFAHATVKKKKKKRVKLVHFM